MLGSLDSHFLRYLVERRVQPGERLPTLSELGAEMGISVGKLREQLELARSMGLVTVRPRVGMQREAFRFSEAIVDSVLFSLASGEASFSHLSKMRRALEASFWADAVALLGDDDVAELQAIVAAAWRKLREEPMHVPNSEHRRLHLGIFRHLANPFVQGLLEVYWDAYQASELTRISSYRYWLEVWSYHERIVQALADKEFDRGQRLLVEHFSLLPAAAIQVESGVARPVSGMSDNDQG